MRARNGHVDVALVGCGRIAQTHLEALQRVADFRLQAVADLRPQVAQSVANQFGCAAVEDYRRLPDSHALAAVIVASPPSSHAEVARFFLERGIHVLCEKPLAITTAEAAALVATAEEHDSLLMMAAKFRYVDDVVRAKGVIDSGILGDVILFENVFCSKVDMRGRWNSDSAIAGGGVLIDNGTHSVDLAQFLLGEIVQVRAEEGKRVQDLGVEDTCRLFFRTAAGAMGSIDLSWSLHKERDAYLEVFGPGGVLSIGWRSSKYRQSEKLDWIEFGRGYDKLAAFTSQLRNFAGSILGRELPLISAADGLQSVRVIEAAYRSLGADRWVDVRPPELELLAGGRGGR
jgi:predicted dehydrogenase